MEAQMKAWLALFAVLIPRPPTVCLNDPVVDSYLCPGSDTHYYFMRREGCDEPRIEFNACDAPTAEDPANFAPAPSVDPDFDEFGPGPGEGPPGAVTVDKP